MRILSSRPARFAFKRSSISYPALLINTMADFAEIGMMVPSTLPPQEQAYICTYISSILNRMGLCNRVFHVEAKLLPLDKDDEDCDNTIDTTENEGTYAGKFQCHTIEINTRRPGARAQLMTKKTFGIDYSAIHLLSALGDHLLLKTMCEPFNVPRFPTGSQCWSQSQSPYLQVLKPEA